VAAFALLARGCIKIGGAGTKKYKIVRELGAGAFGQVLEVESAGRRLALKREKVLTRDPYVTRVYKWVESAPEYFVQIHSYEIIKCKWKHTLPDFLQNKALFDKNFKAAQRAHEKSPYCLETLMEMCDESLQTYFERDEITPAPLGDKRKIVAHLLRSVDWTRSRRLMIRDLHADNKIGRASCRARV
jgi:serine/threonine protein kinase